MTRPTFAEIDASIQQHRSQLDELKSLAYGIQTVDIENKTYSFVCFYDLASGLMKTTLLDQHNNEFHLTNEIPISVIVAYGAFCQSVINWQNGLAEFPVNMEKIYNNFITDYTQHLPNAHIVSDDFKLEP